MKNLIVEALDNFDFDAIKSKSIALGFDGCEDKICKVIRNNNNGSARHFETIAEFSQYIAGMSGLSCSIELDEQISKAGGNSAIFANAISECGIETHVVGLFGKNQTNEVFDELKEKSKLYSYHENAFAFSLEFKDGKIMLSPKVKVSGDVWQRIVQSVGEKNLNKVFLETDMLGLLNWGELEYSTCLWKRVYEFLKPKNDRSKQIIVDLADCLRRTAEDIEEVLELLEAFSKIRMVTLSLNESEALELSKFFYLNAGNDYHELCARLASKIDVQRIVLHSSRCCYTYEDEEPSELLTQFNDSPTLLTGGGDNFNAGYALGCLLGLKGKICNVYGNAMSSYYIKYGKSPDLHGMKDHMEKWYAEVQ